MKFLFFAALLMCNTMFAASQSHPCLNAPTDSIIPHEQAQYLYQIFNSFQESAFGELGYLQPEKYVSLTLISRENWNGHSPPQFQPSDENGLPKIGKGDVVVPTPTFIVNDGNFLFAKSSWRKDKRGGQVVEAEQKISVMKLDELLGGYQNTNTSLETIVIHTNLYNCTQCLSSLIRRLYKRLAIRWNVGVIPIYITFTLGERNNNNFKSITRYEMGLINLVNITNYSKCMENQSRIIAIHRQQQTLLTNNTSLFGFLVSKNLTKEIAKCVVEKHQDKAVRGFIDLLISHCNSTKEGDLVMCFARKTLSVLGNACLSPTTISIAVQDAATFALQAILNPSRKTNDTSDPTVTPEHSFTCNDTRKEGILCSHWNSSYVTAGNSICQKYSPCGFHGERYHWCYTEGSYWDWEYCCTGPCEQHTMNLNSCLVSSNARWMWQRELREYCGSYDVGSGLTASNGNQCMPNHPCGKHGYYNSHYWCYTETTKSWEQCCAPGQNC